MSHFQLKTTDNEILLLSTIMHQLLLLVSPTRLRQTPPSSRWPSVGLRSSELQEDMKSLAGSEKKKKERSMYLYWTASNCKHFDWLHVWDDVPPSRCVRLSGMWMYVLSYPLLTTGKQGCIQLDCSKCSVCSVHYSTEWHWDCLFKRYAPGIGFTLIRRW